MNDNLNNLIKLMRENPGLPVIPIVTTEAVEEHEDFGGDRIASFGEARVTEYVKPTRKWCDAGYYEHNDSFGDIDSKAMVIEDCTNEDLEEIEITNSEIDAAYDTLPWRKAIFVTVTTPEE